MKKSTRSYWVQHKKSDGKPKTVSEILSRERERQGLSMYQLKNLAGISMQTIWSLETAVRRPSFELVSRVAKALGLSLDQIAAELPPSPDIAGRPVGRRIAG